MIDAEGLLDAARREADPVAAARLLAEAFLALSRTADPAALAPVVTRLAALRPRPPHPEVDFLFHTLAGVVRVRAGREHAERDLDIALRLFTEHGLAGDPLYVECAMTATLTAIRPHLVRPTFADLVRDIAERPEVDGGRRTRLTTMLGMGDAWSGDLLRGRAELRRAYHHAVDADRLDLQAEIVSWLVKVEALCGDLAESSRQLAAARELAARSGSVWVAAHIAECAAALHLASGDVEAWAASSTTSSGRRWVATPVSCTSTGGSSPPTTRCAATATRRANCSRGRLTRRCAGRSPRPCRPGGPGSPSPRTRR
ncbi:hypothetical protein ACFQ1L_24065 [Phytohabitans flavus]|uniref:hypothetical protein n=1 Tax=Phytohabitans flavus TaxID=1076124 RepID=UPI00362CDC67